MESKSPKATYLDQRKYEKGFVFKLALDRNSVKIDSNDKGLCF